MAVFSSSAATGLLGLVAGLLLTVGLPAQDTLTYTGPYAAGPLTGQATYAYLLDRKDTVRNGPFEASGSNVVALIAGLDSSFSIRGTYDEGIPTGDWQFRFGAYQLEGPSQVIDHQYQLRTRGRAHLSDGKLLDGQLDGEWRHEEVQIKDSQPTDTVFRSTITFVDGVPQQAFQLEGEASVLLGRFKRDGTAHDTWTLYSDMQARENWYFVDGRLDRIDVMGEAGTMTIPVLSTGAEKVRRINLDARYFQLLEVYQLSQGREAFFADSKATELLITNAARYRTVADAVTDLGGRVQSPLFTVNVPDLSLSRQELLDLDEIQLSLREMDTLRREIEGNTSFAILETADPEVAALRARLGELTGSALDGVRQLNTAREQGILDFLPRADYLRYLFGPGAAPELSKLVDTTRLTLNRVSEIRNALNEKLNTQERQQVQTALDDELLYEYGLLDSLINVRKEGLPKEYGLRKVQVAAGKLLRDYATIDNLMRKRERARELIDCMTDFSALSLTLSQLPQQRQEVKELYTDEVWNNFTATIMKERVKKRISEAYAERLIPYLLDRVTDDLNCSEAARLNREFVELHERMRDLRARDTEELEDRLKETDDPRATLELFRSALQK
jgi:hypothetical protein